MENGLGELGFWLMVGMIVAATIVSEGFKERDKEREKQATLRALLQKDGKSATEVLTYMRERDAAVIAEAARERARSSRIWTKVKAVALGIFAFALGIYAFVAVYFGLLRGSGSVLSPLVAMLAIWAAGLLITRPIWRSVKQKHDAQPDE